MDLNPYLMPKEPEGFNRELLPAICRTPMMLHYISIKAKYPQAIVFYRMGDFYEMFFEDAKIASKLLDLTLTARSKSDEAAIPMAGVPHHAAPQYIQKLTDCGWRVAICDQVEDASLAQGMVKREVTRVVTPALILDPMLGDQSREPLMSVIGKIKKEWIHLRYGVSSGLCEGSKCDSLEEILDQIEKYSPQEILIDDGMYGPFVQECNSQGRQSLLGQLFRITILSAHSNAIEKRVLELLNVKSLEGFGLEVSHGEFLPAVGALLTYLDDSQKHQAWATFHFVEESKQKDLHLDANTYKNLEILKSQDTQSPQSCLAACFPELLTGLGMRALVHRFLHPSRDRAWIQECHEKINYLNEERASVIGLSLSKTHDVDRLTQKTLNRTLTPYNCLQLAETIVAAQEIVLKLQNLGPFPSDFFPPLIPLSKKIRKTLQDQPTGLVGEGKVIATGVDETLDSYRDIFQNTNRWLTQYETQERERTGISSLKIKYSRVFGFSIEVSKSNLSKVPQDYQRRQTLANGERYMTSELTRFEEKWTEASEKIHEIEQRIFNELVEALSPHCQTFLELSKWVAELDLARAGFLKITKNNYCLPIMTEGSSFHLQNSRHPVLERQFATEFVPNSISLGAGARFILLTGPNMSGKSTLMRQVGLIIFLAYCGFPIPCESAEIGEFDQILTRVGASDRLSRGQSTFMVEMIETATILRHATEKSLVLVDEIGRGTSTYDGLAIAWAVAEHLIEKTKGLTFFATHYHELVALEDENPSVKCGELSILESGGKVLFLRKFQWGACQKSFGINVAKFAGVPKSVVDRAQKKLDELNSRPLNSQMRLI